MASRFSISSLQSSPSQKMTENDSIPAPKRPGQIIAESLIKKGYISISNIGSLRERYINLRTQEIFDSLVDLYAQVFMSQWQHYTDLMNRFSQSTMPPHIYAARCYISMWFIDLYVSNRKAVTKFPSIAFNERYQGELCPISHEYDNYLVLLNASIRPTHIKNAIHNNGQYIPIIADFIDVNNPNPFGIVNFISERNMFYGLTQIMKERRLLRFNKLSSDPHGRPCWLFDWHFKDKVGSWFPDKDNYDMDDVNLAYILGTACTSNLGSRDPDYWQYFADGIVPHNPNPKSYDRVNERRFFGSYEVRTMEIDPEFSLASVLPQLDPAINTYLAEKGITPAKIRPRFRLIDWLYYCRVIHKMDDDTRAIAHGLICGLDYYI